MREAGRRWTPHGQLRLQPLSADYWRRSASDLTTEIPYLRIAAAFMLSPLLVALPFALIALAIYANSTEPMVYRPPIFGPAPLEDAWERAVAETWRTFQAIWLGVALQVGVGGLIAGPLLWSLRLRSRTAWALAGLVVGGTFALIAWINTQTLSSVALSVTVLFGLCAFLSFRWIAGVQKLRRR